MEETFDEGFQCFYYPCEWEGIRAIHIEADSIEKGIIQFIQKNHIRHLVMGAAADEHYSRAMISVKSKKAVYVMDNAPLSCHISFICNGYLIQSSQKLPIRDSPESSTGKNEPVHTESNEEAESPIMPSRNESESNEHYYDQLDHAMKEALAAAFSEAVRKKGLDLREKELQFIHKLWKKVIDELRETTVEKFSLQKLIEKSNLSLREWQDKLISNHKILQAYENRYKESNEVRRRAEVQRNKALAEAEILRNQLAQSPSSSIIPIFFSLFSFTDLEKATNNFDPNFKIGEGGYGSIYKGFLRYTEVAIKLLDPNSMQGPKEFYQEVDVLSKMGHPNMVTLIGACMESRALVYEYLPGGSLEDRLMCKNNSLPLPWQIRVRIATELCSALIFLHTSRPGCIIHGDLKPSNILLDENCVCKLGDFGICRVVQNGENSMDNTTFILNTQPKGTFTYLDPEYLSTGEFTPMCDVYSFGIILLQLLTGKSALGLRNEVESALAESTLDTLLDPSAGDWPYVQARQLARMALRCCDMKRKNRPDLESDVWRLLEPMKSSCQNLSILRLTPDNQVPSYFKCPIFQEIMEDPHIASDGYTYEAEAIKGWLASGHNSPMTNVKLANHNLVPNRALRSAIQEWLTHNRCE